ncbi:MAG: hypothetical protein ABSD92_04585 [Candidatus Bathyarchaeia archaeon]|jgi:prefoldin subunit 5
MSDEKDSINEKLANRLLKLEQEIESLKDDLTIWTDALEELSEIEDAFKTDGKPKIQGKTILDVGTDAVKPLYIALKFKPSKIIGIDELCFRPYCFNLESQSKIFTDTKIRLYGCSLFDEVTFNRIRVKEGIRGRFNFVLVSKALHHLRTEKCVEEQECSEDEESCKYGFNTETIFKKLLSLGKRVIVYESFDDAEEDLDKTRGRGGYLGKNCLLEVLKGLSKNEEYQVHLVRPQSFNIDKTTLDRVEPILRQVDCICFYVEKISDT